MKNHKQVVQWISVSGPVPEVVANIHAAASEMVNPIITRDCYGDFHVEGWVPFTEKEMEVAKRARARARARANIARQKAKAKQEEAERKELERLQKKYWYVKSC